MFMVITKSVRADPTGASFATVCSPPMNATEALAMVERALARGLNIEICDLVSDQQLTIAEVRTRASE